MITKEQNNTFTLLDGSRTIILGDKLNEKKERHVIVHILESKLKQNDTNGVIYKTRQTYR